MNSLDYIFKRDRCVNPSEMMDVSKELRTISKRMLPEFHDLLKNAKICSAYRKQFYVTNSAKILEITQNQNCKI